MNWLVILLFVALLLALKNILEKEFLRSEHTMMLLFWSACFVWLYSLSFSNDIVFITSPTLLFLIFTRSLLMALASYGYFHLIKRSELSAIVPWTNVFPIFVLIMSFLLYGETISMLQFVGMSIIIMGGYFLQAHHFHDLFKPLSLLRTKKMPYLLGIFLLWSCVCLIDRYVIKQVPVTSFIFYGAAFLTLTYLTWITLRGYVHEIVEPLQRHYVLIGVVSLLALSVRFLYLGVLGSALLPLSIIVTVVRTSSLFSTLFGGKFFHEQRIAHKGACCAVMLVGVFILFI